MSTIERSRSHSIRASFSKLCRQISVRRNSKDSVLSGIEVWEDLSNPSTESHGMSQSSSQTDISSDTGLENFLMPSRTLNSVTEDEALTTSLARYRLADQPFVDTSQPFRFLDLPLEIRRSVYKHYFPPREATLRVKRSTTDCELIVYNPWRESQAILLSCQEIYRTAKEFSKSDTLTLDLSQYTVKLGDLLPISKILSRLGEVGSQCSRLIVSREQPWNIIEPRLFPVLRKVEIWDYSQWRSQLYATDSTRMAADFEGECRNLLRQGAAAILADNKSKLPAGVIAQVNLVCDLLVCVESNETRPKQDKLRHIFSLSDKYVSGEFTKVDWTSKHSDMGPLPLHHLIAPHMHDYCLHLREHDPELVARASC